MKDEFDKPRDRSSEFQRGAELPTPSLWIELFDFLRHNKKWWMTPIILVLLLLGALVVLQGTAAAPFIYTFW